MSSGNWRAPHRGRVPIDATVTIPGSKSVTNRALVLAALANSPSRLIRPLASRDTELMSKGLRALGVGIQEVINPKSGEVEWQITPGSLTGPGSLTDPGSLMGPASIDVGNAGTVMRFLLPVAALAAGLINFDGDPRSHERPLGPLIKALEELGVSIDHKARYALPLTINGSGGLPGGSVEVDASQSSQFLSALMLAAPRMKHGLLVKHIGAHLPSQPHIEMTIQLLERFGATVTRPSETSWQIQPGGLHGVEMVIEPDLSNAAPFMAMPIICGGAITIRDWPRATTQPGDRLREIFTAMGATIEFTAEGVRVTGTGEINGIDIDLSDEGELTPSIAAVAALASSPSYLRGIGHLRLHETDRLQALARELGALGCEVIEEESALQIKPRALHAGTFHTYEDHRLATAGAMLGLAIDGIEVENIETTRKTLPDFPGLWASALGNSH